MTEEEAHAKVREFLNPKYTLSESDKNEVKRTWNWKVYLGDTDEWCGSVSYSWYDGLIQMYLYSS
jgi:hypothetical protein